MIEARRRWMLTAAAAAAASALARPVAAQGTPREGRDYRLVKPQQPTEAPAGKIEVIEFFWYGCPHCNSLEPLLQDWIRKLPADVFFRRVHVPFGDRRHQQLHYTLEAMGKAEALGDKVFHAIHVDNDRLDTVDKMTAMLSRYGVDGVPAMAVNGKYYTSPSMAGSNQASLRVMDWLIAQERQARK